MKLLIITQKVDKNDPILGFFHRWIEEFSKHCESVIVICLRKGEYNLPKNVKVLSLGKEKGVSRIKYLINFYKYIWSERGNYDRVFVHMNPVYILLVGIFWRAFGKKVSLWYTHKSVDLKLKVAEKLSHIIFSASKESFRLKSKKLLITGHGIDTEIFKPTIDSSSNEYIKICSIARISKAKNQKLMIDVVQRLIAKGIKLQFYIVGSAVTKDDKVYESDIRKYASENNLSGQVIFQGNIIHRDIPSFLQKMDIFINLSNTGSLDKAVLEAMACGLKIVTSNEAFKDILGKENIVDSDADVIADRIIDLSKVPSNTSFNFRKVVEEENSLNKLIIKILDSIK
jgi:glycosyltransferase involved in cell wall biosynthesis